MLRVLYLAGLFKWEEGSWRVLCCGCFRRCNCSCLEELTEEGCTGETKGSWTAEGLKRQLIRRSVSPALVFSSVVADIDVATDWYFYTSDDVQKSGFEGVSEAALFFTVLGTITWVLLATDGLGWLRVGACRWASCKNVYRHWAIVNTILEDLPQLVLTFMTAGFNSVPGALNITAAVFAFMAKAAEAYASRGDDLATDFEGVTDGNTRPLVEARLDLADRVATETDALKEATDSIGTANRYPDRRSSMLKTFMVARNQGPLVRFAVNVREIKLVDVDLEGSISAERRKRANLSRLYLRSSQLTGSIPADLGRLSNLTLLNLSHNQLTGPIPVELAKLVNLTLLDLSNNKLTGTIPAEFQALHNLASLDLSENQLTGLIPAELGMLANLTSLHLGGNGFTGTLPKKLLELIHLEELNTLRPK